MDPWFVDKGCSRTPPTPWSSLAIHTNDLSLAPTHKEKTETTSLVPIKAILEEAKQTETETSDPFADNETSTLNDSLPGESHFLKILPREVRDEIYKLLLVNPILGSAESVIDLIAYGPNANRPAVYGLSTDILCVNRQIYAEASSCLYEQNTFFVYCIDADPYRWNPYFDACYSPITRYLHDQHVVATSHDHANIARVRKWNVLATLDTRRRRDPRSPLGLHQFCRSISRASPRQVKMSFLIYFDLVYRSDLNPDPFMVRDLSSLNMLRNIQNFEIIQPTHQNRVQIVQMDFDDGYWYNLQEIPTVLADPLTQVAMSNAPLECPADIYDNLLAYARTFEGFLPYRKAMGLDQMEILLGAHLINSFSSEDSEQVLGLNIYNPYTSGDDDAHPVEHGLLECRIWSQRDDLAHVKECRAQVLDFLEPQYQRISAASMALKKFAQQGQLTHRFHDSCTYALNKKNCRKALKLLKSYCFSFNRAITKPVYERAKKHVGTLEYLDRYESRASNTMRLAERALKERDFDGFKDYFDEAARQLGQDFFDIQSARQKLFSWDITERGCDIETGEDSLDDKPSRLKLEYPLCEWEQFKTCYVHRTGHAVAERVKKAWGKLSIPNIGFGGGAYLN